MDIYCSICLHFEESTGDSDHQTRIVSTCDLKPTDVELIKLRTKCLDIKYVCHNHLKIFLSNFEDKQRICCDPFKKHNKNVRKGLKSISLSFSQRYQNIELIPGTKLCISCRKSVVSNETDHNVSISSDSDYEPNDSCYVIEKLNESCQLIDCSPLKVTKRKVDDRNNYLKIKAQRVAASFSELATKALGVESSSSASKNNEEAKQHCTDCITLMEKLKQKFVVSNINEQIQILTLVPESWTKQQTVNFFETTDYLVKKARKILKNEGILYKSDKKKGHTLPEEIVKNVKIFYYDDEISRISSNTKDCISVPSKHGKRELKTKRLILHNLRDVYLSYKEKYPNHKIGFTKFCELRPKECVTVNSRGIHTVCVCTYHQNVKLMMQSIHLKITYQELLQKLVCDLQSEECMLHRCPNCPDVSSLRDFLMQLEFIETSDTVTFKQWLYTDRSMIETIVKTVDDFIEMLIEKLNALTQHHFIAKAQSVHLKEIKNNLPANVCLILSDFSENYTCVLQDAAQGFHWQNIQATLHPFVVYFKSEEEIKSLSMCFISDCLKHDTTTFFAFQKTAIQYILQELPLVNHVIYFSDGSSAQYKNYKNFINLCHHKKDHSITAEWYFFATSHGKNACDGVGGTIKRLATRASLQRTTDGFILSAEDLYKFASENIKGIKIFYTASTEIYSCQEFLQERYSNAKTVPGTRENHYFLPINETTVMVKRVSSSQMSFRAVVGCKNKEDLIDIAAEKYYAVIYGKNWWVGKVQQCSVEERDAKVQFMHPSGPSKTFSWPTPSDSCWVPFENIIQEIPVPATTSTTGRIYVLEENIQRIIVESTKYIL